VDRGQLPKHSDRRWVDTDFLRRLPEGRLDEGFAGIGGAARQTDLPGMACEPACPHRQGDRGPGRRRIQQQQRRRRAGFRRKHTRAPRLAEHFGREADLRLDAGQRARQALTKGLFNLS
jgi:hypothetical protein